MNIALDYDGTYTTDPQSFLLITEILRKAGHKVFIVTMRYSSEAILEQVGKYHFDGIFYTSRSAKKPFMDSINIHIDIWIDDNPHWILEDSN